MNFKKSIRTILIALVLVAFEVTGTTPLLSAKAATATVRYVDVVSGIDSGKCNASTTPCKSIQFAVNKSVSGDVILVAAGTYSYNSAADVCSTSSYGNIKPGSVVCFVDKSLTILGGYSSADWSVSNPTANPTIIDGSGAYRGVYALGYTNVKTGYLDMEGFTIQNTLVQGPTSLSDDGIGGGMLIQQVSVILRNMVFKNNVVRGKNASSGAGGQGTGAGLFIQSPQAGTSLLQRVLFDNNQSYGGTGPKSGGIAFGALFIMTASVTIQDTVFTNNLAQAGSSTGDGAVNGVNEDALGGAISAEGAYSVSLSRVSMTGNRANGGNATKYGGGAFGAAIVVEDTTSFYLGDSFINGNVSSGGTAQNAGIVGGGAIHANNNGQLTIERSSIVNNSAIGGSSTNGGSTGLGYGGGMYIFASKGGASNTNIINSVIAGNLATQGATGTSSNWNGGAGGIIANGINMTIDHSTIAGNSLGSNMVLGMGLVLQTGSSLPATGVLNNCIIADHKGSATAAAIVVLPGSSLTIHKGLLAGNSKDTNSDSQPLPPGTITGLATMISASSAGFVSPGTPNDNYHLRLNSPARDQASTSAVSVDMDGQNRPNNDVPDLGADEYWPFSVIAVPGDTSIRLDWTAGASAFAGGVNHYEVVVTCVSQADPPAEGGCNQPINTGQETSFLLTGLTNFKPYNLIIRARDASNNLVADSITLSDTPTDKLVFLPFVVR
jgi:hypothetical protein